MNSPIYLSVPRKNDRINCSSEDLYADLYDFWENSNYIYRNFTGFIDDDVNGIFTSIELVQSSYAKDYYLRYHELVFSIPINSIDETSAISIFETIHSYIAQTYQVLMVICYDDRKLYIQGRFFINAVSPFDGSKFKDNRSFFTSLSNSLSKLIGLEIKLDDGVLFGLGEDNYSQSSYK